MTAKRKAQTKKTTGKVYESIRISTLPPEAIEWYKAQGKENLRTVHKECSVTLYNYWKEKTNS